METEGAKNRQRLSYYKELDRYARMSWLDPRWVVAKISFSLRETLNSELSNWRQAYYNDKKQIRGEFEKLKQELRDFPKISEGDSIEQTISKLLQTCETRNILTLQGLKDSLRKYRKTFEALKKAYGDRLL